MIFLQHQIKSMIIVALVLCVCFSNIEVDAAQNTSDSEANPYSSLFNEAGTAVMIQTETADGFAIAMFFLVPDAEWLWSTAHTGDHVSLEYPYPISKFPKDEQPVTECGEGVDPAAAAAISSAGASIKDASATRQCPWPLFPDDNLYKAEFSNGLVAYLRLPQSAMQPQVVWAENGIEKLAMKSVSSLEVAKGMLEGEWVEPKDFSLDSAICHQECLNLVASDTQEGSLDQLVNSAEVSVKLLDFYKDRYGEFPSNLYDLFEGDNAVCGGFIHNPFDADMYICNSSTETSAQQNEILHYIPETAEVDGKSSIVGYWLAVLGSGEEVEPEVALPSGINSPNNAVMWFETHPES